MISLNFKSRQNNIKFNKLILTRKRILDEISRKNILIEPFREECLGLNSYDLHLGKYILTYTERVLDSRIHNPVEEMIIPNEGMVLYPGVMYLGVTDEYIETHTHVPFLEGIASVGRLGIAVNPSSGKGSVGHCNTFTMEINVVHPVRIYKGMPIAQVFFIKVEGEVEVTYTNMKTAKYTSRTIKPSESMMWKNDF